MAKKKKPTQVKDQPEAAPTGVSTLGDPEPLGPELLPFGLSPQTVWFEQAFSKKEITPGTMTSARTDWNSRMSHVGDPAPDSAVPGLDNAARQTLQTYGMGDPKPYYQVRTDKTAGGQPEDPDNPPQVEEREILNLAFTKAPLPVRMNAGDTQFTKEDISSEFILSETVPKYQRELHSRGVYIVPEILYPDYSPAFQQNNMKLKDNSKWIFRADGTIVLRATGEQALSQIANES